MRKSPSWIDSFIEHTDNLHAPQLFRKWAAITTLASVLEQKVWLTTSSPIYPNLYVMLIGNPGSGKTRTIRVSRKHLGEIADFHLGPISLTWASLIDALVRSKRMIVRLPDEALEYNSMLIAPDEIGAFMHKWDTEMADGLSALYDPDPYSQERRGGDLRIKIKSPQINMLSGATPSRLLELMPEGAWGQGLTSRIIFVYSEEEIVGDDFASVTRGISKDLLADLKHINSISGEFKVTEDYRGLINLWREQKEEPKPIHPKLVYYNARRRVNLYKLSMIAAIDRSDVLTLTRDDFNQAMNWLVEAEVYMADIFKAAAAGPDGAAMEEIYHFVMIGDITGKGVSEHRIVRFAQDRVPVNSVMKVLEIMERSQQIKEVGRDIKTGLRMFKAVRKD